MRNWTLLTIVCVMWAGAEAQANMQNEIMKECLSQNGYKLENFDTFNFSKASACYHKWHTAETTKDLEKQRTFLKENPWFTGKNYKWKERAEYTCTRRYDLGGLEICRKPIYIN